MTRHVAQVEMRTVGIEIVEGISVESGIISFSPGWDDVAGNTAS